MNAAAQPGTPVGLAEELRQIEAAHPGWHIWRSDGGLLWATTVSHCLGSGCTVDGGSPECLNREIAKADHAWQAGVAA